MHEITKPFDELNNQQRLLRIAQNFLLTGFVIPHSKEYIEASYTGTDVELSVEASVWRPNDHTFMTRYAYLRVDDGDVQASMKVDRNWEDTDIADDPYGDYFVESFIKNYPYDITGRIALSGSGL